MRAESVSAWRNLNRLFTLRIMTIRFVGLYRELCNVLAICPPKNPNELHHGQIAMVYTFDKCRNRTCGLHLLSEPTNAVRMAARGFAMGQEAAEDADLGRLCQGISPSVAACTDPRRYTAPRARSRSTNNHDEDER
jgi:hypothetical protein